VADLFPDTLRPCEVGIAGLPPFVPRFFALYPDPIELPEVAKRQSRLCGELAPPDTAPRPPWMLHVSVALCGVPRRLRYPMEEALDRAQEAFSFPAFNATFDRTAGFGNDRTAFVAIADTCTTKLVHDLRRALADAQQPFGLFGEKGATVPHLTLGYSKQPIDQRNAIEPICFRAKEVFLVISTGRSKHLCVGRWPLDR
jgi:2'-5' RNA ligase